MLNVGDIAFHLASELQQDAARSDFVVVNCGYYIASFAPSRHHKFEEHALILYQHKGLSKIKANNLTYNFAEGSVAIFPPNSVPDIYYENDKINERYYIFCNGTKFNEILNSLGLNGFIYNIGVFNEFIDATKELLNDFKINRFDNATYKKILLLNIFAKMRRIISSHDKTPFSMTIISRALSHMQQNFKEKYLSTNAYAKMCAVSENTFVKYFKMHTGSTPLKYFTDLKINNAMQQLTNTNRTINEIAYDLNFDDPLYFSRLFKSVTGYAPSHYRNKT